MKPGGADPVQTGGKTGPAHIVRESRRGSIYDNCIFTRRRHTRVKQNFPDVI